MSKSIETILDEFTQFSGYPRDPKTYWEYRTIAIAAMLHARMRKSIDLFTLSAYFFVRLNRLDIAFELWRERNALFSERLSYTSP